MSTTTALVGCAHIHIRGFTERLAARDDVHVKAAWDHDRARAEKWGAPLGATLVDTLDAIWNDDEIDAVIINSETDRHAALVEAAAAAGKHLFVEKPLGVQTQETFTMAAQIERANVLFQTGYFMRGAPTSQFLREQIARGHFGRITRIRHVNAHSGALGGWFDTEWRWMTERKQAGVGAFGDLGAHSLDLILWLMSAQAANGSTAGGMASGPTDDAADSVTRATASIGSATGRYGDIDEYGEGLLDFASGAVGSLAAGWVSVANPITLEISGTEGHAHICSGELFFQSQHVDGADGQSPWTELPNEWPHAFELFLDAVVEQTERGSHSQPLVSAREAAERVAVMDALYTGAEGGRWVEPESEQ